MSTPDDLRVAPVPSSRRPFGVHVTADAQHFAVALHGECDISALEELRAAYGSALNSPAPRVTVDLSGCTFIDSTCVGALLAFHRQFGDQRGRELVIVPGPPLVQRVFELCSVVDVLPFERR